MQTTTDHRVGFRFDRSDLPLLRALTRKAVQDGLGGTAAVFDRATVVTELGEALRFICADEQEARDFAANCVRCGLRPPTLEPIH